MKVIFVSILGFILADAALAGDLATAKRLAVTCTACHGEKGISNSPIWPNLAGQKKEYLVKQIKAFKNGDRKDIIMSQLAQTVGDDDIDILAEYFSRLN